ncbi:hypothetical protein [Gracilibacillus lacisalsi]|uniref:hypothetical protein n=1 Tax=Gracilibacillus lacisalsi TaxID=393087 RepID=UPI00037531CC|nr:hypothetical protein [Gracilibacillus lacisalsi]
MTHYFYETYDPYYAIIRAEDEEQAKGFYEEVVADVDDEESFYATLEVKSEEYVRGKMIGINDLEGRLMTPGEKEELIGVNGIIVMDASLV